MTDHLERARTIDAQARTLYQAAPQAMKPYAGLMAAAAADGAIDGKTKELMAVSIAVAIRCEGCITYHARAAVKKGASREEVAEAIAVAVEMGGGPAAVYGAEALSAFDQFAEAN
jgi:AhpD family alkylhydroperoxidase